MTQRNKIRLDKFVGALLRITEEKDRLEASEGYLAGYRREDCETPKAYRYSPCDVKEPLLAYLAPVIAAANTGY